jgi:CubicO group peptidase (beta-lactamase class C family)
MNRFFGRLLVVVAAAALAVSGPAPAGASLNPMLKPYLSRYRLPALAAAVIKKGKIVSAGAVGTRRAGVNIPVTINDRFHIGSNTKAMTALLAAMLVEEGKLQWTSTVSDVFPELKGEMNSRLRVATLQQLLSHTSGIPYENKDLAKVLAESCSQEGNLDELRYWFVRKWSEYRLLDEPGAGFAYSNLGYTIAGAMIERRAGRTWEELITEKVFKPLKMRTAGLGPQSSIGKIDAPLGHTVVRGKVKPMFAGPNGDNPLIIGPAGSAHMSVLDFARWAGWNAGEGKRRPKLVKVETIRKLHTPVVKMSARGNRNVGTPAEGKYALGWVAFRPDWSPYPLLMHSGSNGMNLAKIWIDPKRDFAMVFMTNIGGSMADQALDALAGKLYARFGKTRHRASAG